MDSLMMMRQTPPLSDKYHDERSNKQGGLKSKVYLQVEGFASRASRTPSSSARSEPSRATVKDKQYYYTCIIKNNPQFNGVLNIQLLVFFFLR